MKEVKKNNISFKVNELGAELKSLTCDGKEYIWSSDPKFWKRSAPFLFPIVGSMKGHKTIINGKEYTLTQHGFLRDQVFDVVLVEDSKIVFEKKYSEETLMKYPFKYKAKVTYEIIDESLKTSVEITNLGEEEMPFNIGGHPAFNCPLYDNETFEDYKVVFEKPETFGSPLVVEGGLLDFDKPVYALENAKEINLKKDIFTIDTILIRDVKSKSVKLLNKENKGIEFSYPKFSTLAIWTPYNEAPFICLEPWIGYNDLHDTNGEYLTKADLVKLNPNESYEVSYTIKIIK